MDKIEILCSEELRIKLGSHSRQKTEFMIRLKILELKEEGKDVSEEELYKIVIPTTPLGCLDAYRKMQRLLGKR